MTTFIKKGIVLGDFHCPYQDPNMLALAAKFITNFDPHELVLIGDQLNYATYSRHGARKNERPDEQLRVDHSAAELVLDTLTERVRPSAVLVWHDGNHETWQDDFYTANPTLFDERIHRHARLQLAKRGFTVLPWKGGVWQTGKLHTTHGFRAGLNAVRDHLNRDFKANFVMGHIHRSDTATSSNITGHVIQGYSVGCMSKLDFRYSDSQNSNHGFGVYYVLPNGNFSFYNIVAVDYKFVFEGQLFQL